MTPSSLRKLLYFLLVLLLLWLGVRFLLPIALPFLFAALLALCAEPLVRGLHRHCHLPRAASSALGVSVVLLLTVLALLALCALLIREMGTLTRILPDLESATSQGLDSLEIWLLGLAQNAPKGISPILIQGVEGIFSNGSALLDGLASRLLNLAASILKAIPDSALGLGTWVLATFMLSARLPQLRQWCSRIFPPAWREKYAPYLHTLKKSICGWLLAQSKLVGITFAVLACGFFLLRIEHPILWAAATCIVDILPILGTGTVLIPWSIVCFLQNDGLRAVGLLGIYAVVTLLRSVLEPRFVGKHLGLDPLITLLAIYAGYRLWGLVGMLIAPVFAVGITQLLLQGKHST